MTSTSVLLLGLLVGLRHAFEPDHLAAVSTLVTEQRTSRTACLLGVLWGVGHAMALLVVVMALGMLGMGMPPALATAFEFGVALMLMFLGVRTLVKAANAERSGPVALHHHHGLLHQHAFLASDHVHVGDRAFARRSLLVGLLHGLAGSGSLAALVAVQIPSATGRVLYVVLFGLGAIVGMAALSGLAGWPLARLARRPAVHRVLRIAAGTVAILVGALWAWPIVTSI